VESVTVEQTNWALSPERHEGGTPNFVGAVALAAATVSLTGLLRSGALEAHESALRGRLREGLEPLGGVRLLRIWSDSADAVGIVAFEVEGHEAGLVAAYLSCEHGIGVRDGKFCAHPLLARVNGGRGALRASFGLGSTAEDIDRLVQALNDYLRHGPRHRYSRRDRWFAPEGDSRPRPFPEVDLADPALSAPSSLPG
jgi:selenocysteine lyase/cysteine desulfurase